MRAKALRTSEKRGTAAGMRALVADDDATIRRLLRRCLENLGCVVEDFDNGEALLEAARRLKPAMVICDIHMPGNLNGREACQAIRAEGMKTIIILTTGSNGATRGEESDFILVKPFLITELQEVVTKLLKRLA